MEESDENLEISKIDQREWETIYSLTKKLKAKDSNSFETNLKKKGVFSLQINILSKMALPGSKIKSYFHISKL